MARNGAIAVIAKCPMAGKSKTRLIPLLGEQGSAALARAMLSDVLTSLSRCVSPLLHQKGRKRALSFSHEVFSIGRVEASEKNSVLCSPNAARSRNNARNSHQFVTI
jgi:hypothetical protein